MEQNIAHKSESETAIRFRTWKVEVGQFNSGRELRKAMMEIGIRFKENWAHYTLGRPSFPMRREPGEATLFCVSFADLGFVDGAKLSDAFNFAKLRYGFDLCTPEEGYQLRYSYTDQPLGEVIYIAMKQIVGSGGGMGILKLFEGNNISCIPAKQDSFWNAKRHFVFSATDHQIQKFLHEKMSDKTVKLRSVRNVKVSETPVVKELAEPARRALRVVIPASKIVQMIMSIKLFSTVSFETAHEISKYFSIKEFNARNPVFLEGNSDRHAYFLAAGTLQAFWTTMESGERTMLRIYCKGDSLAPLTEGNIARCTTVPREKVKLLRVFRSDLERIFDTFPEIGKRHRIDVMTSYQLLAETLVMFRADADERIKSTLQRYVQTSSDNNFLRCGKITHQEIADTLLIARETVTRKLKDMPTYKALAGGGVVLSGEM